ncbi:MAG: (2Fe-2S)-binding protein [Deltaproteobacteria bacterium]|nr:(2Fe-2S)-binding protein [Deltaproteobacteria bacterium]
MTQRVFVCRCEDVTVAEIEHAIALGLASVEELKRYTGLGTGPCQGKECMVTLVQLLLARGVVTPAQVQPFTARPPAEPVTLAELASAAAPRASDAEGEPR